MVGWHDVNTTIIPKRKKKKSWSTNPSLATSIFSSKGFPTQKNKQKNPNNPQNQKIYQKKPPQKNQPTHHHQKPNQNPMLSFSEILKTLKHYQSPFFLPVVGSFPTRKVLEFLVIYRHTGEVVHPLPETAFTPQEVRTVLLMWFE